MVQGSCALHYFETIEPDPPLLACQHSNPDSRLVSICMTNGIPTTKVRIFVCCSLESYRYIDTSADYVFLHRNEISTPQGRPKTHKNLRAVAQLRGFFPPLATSHLMFEPLLRSPTSQSLSHKHPLVSLRQSSFKTGYQTGDPLGHTIPNLDLSKLRALVSGLGLHLLTTISSPPFMLTVRSHYQPRYARGSTYSNFQHPET